MREENEQSQKTPAEKRRHTRFEIVEYAHISRADQIDTVAGLIVDIGLGGLQAVSRTPFSPGEKCVLAIGRGGGDPLLVKVESRHIKPLDDAELYSVGFRFTPQSVDERMNLVDYIHSAFQRFGESLSG